MQTRHTTCKYDDPFWTKAFLSLGVLTTITAFFQSVLQLYCLRISVKYDVIPYIWFFILSTWTTLIYLGHTIHLIYLVKRRRCSELSKCWWYFAVAVLVVNPSQSVWWWFSEDFILAYVSTSASVVYFTFFAVVCHSIAPIKLTKRKRILQAQLSRMEEEEAASTFI